MLLSSGFMFFPLQKTLRPVLLCLILGLSAAGCSGSDVGLEPENGFTFTDSVEIKDNAVLAEPDEGSPEPRKDPDVISSVPDDIPEEDLTTPPPEPGEFGYPCESPDDCDSGFCVGSNTGKVCTQFCFDECPMDWDCKEVKNPTGDPIFICLPRATNLCRPCKADGDCIQNGGELGDRCVNFSQEEGSFCGTACVNNSECPQGYECQDVPTLSGQETSKQCMPASGECYCNPLSIELSSETLCSRTLDAAVCTGKRVCTTDGLSDCDAPEPEVEICNLEDEDCDGEIDESVPVESCLKENDIGTCPGITQCQGGLNICKAPEASVEVCDGIDNDCNGVNDDGFDDFDGDEIADCADEDDDNDSIPDVDDNCPFTPNTDQIDTDSDTKGNACDPDDDNDKVLDGEDNCPLAVNSDQEDVDGDGAGNACDDDDDGDGVFDIADNCPLVPNPSQADQDVNGVGDLCDGDADGDTIPNEDDNCATAYNPNQEDNDGDGEGDPCDLDDDNDAIADTQDNCPLIANPEQINTDLTAAETAGDEKGDACDDDDDDDGWYDSQDNCSLNYNPGQENFDGDSFGDICDKDKDGDTVCDAPGLDSGCVIAGPDNCLNVPNLTQENADNDQWGDACDEDDDNDFIMDDGDGSGVAGDRPCMSSLCPGCTVQCDDNCTLKWNPQQDNMDGDLEGDACDIDKDGDSFPNDTDNCPNVYNPDQANTDNEGEGDACDPDIDNDNIPNETDNCPGIANVEQIDQDGDNVGDPCDPDLDGDEVCDSPGLSPGCSIVGPDNCIFIQNPDQKDNESDLIGDVCDPDDDNDGICDSLADSVDAAACSLYSGKADNCPLVANPNQANFDSDGFGDICDEDDDNDNDPDYTDCNDYNALVNSLPGTIEYCNGIDDNCVGGVDEANTIDCINHYYDNDGDGFGTSQYECLCNPQSYYRAFEAGDCNDSDIAVHPDAAEVCNNVDDNCDNIKDPPGSPGSTKYYKDKDGDLYGLDSDSMMLCGKDYVAKYTAETSGDCNDDNYAVNPGAKESCFTAYDDDCVGGANEEKPQGYVGSGYKTYYRDADNDGWGDSGNQKTLCAATGSWDTTTGGDCCDSDSNAKPGQNEWYASTNNCGGWDYNCNNNTDYQYNKANVECNGGGFSGCSVSEAGWDGGRPGCGSSAKWLKDCSWSWGSCKKKTENRQQKCR